MTPDACWIPVSVKSIDNQYVYGIKAVQCDPSNMNQYVLLNQTNLAELQTNSGGSPLMNLSIEGATQISIAILVVWAIAWGYRVLIRMVKPSLEESQND